MTRMTSCADAEAVARRAADEVLRQLQAARAERGVAHVALSGGRTPQRTYELLALQSQQWHAVQLWFADERCVEPQDQQSNYRLVAETLLGPAAIAPQQVHRMEGERGPEEGASRYAAQLLAHAPAGAGANGQTMPVLDLVVLGIGEEGHVASLFPDSPMLDEDATPCLGVHNSPKPPPQRITLSLAVLRAARRCLLLATGAEKAAAVSAMLAEPSRQVPASLLARERLTVIADDAASPEPSAR